MAVHGFRFVQIAVSTGIDGESDFIYALDEAGDVWSRKVAGSRHKWLRMIMERESEED